MASLKDKTVLVTGGSRGIGRSIVLACAAEGANVAFTYKSAGTAAEAVVKEVEALGKQALALQSDAKDSAAAQQTVDRVISAWTRLDVLVNNAGITKDGLLMRMSDQDWTDVIDTNLKSAFNFAKAVCRPMMGQRSGRIINISSISGVIGNAGQVNYSAAKAGMIGLTKSLAKELASRNIQVNAVAPGFVDTDMTEKLTPQQREALMNIIPMKRTAKPEEIASVVVFLAGPGAGYITGQVLCVDGGIVM
ncbi:MAG: 3-oxoacyl-[acyl-carrier-protein] reductase [Ignavibacteria bacterium GWA2_55_11]|nr:MAG: 3-oxoacyl-[acyl-carrier-protein] reductase [Ignavibacteria bacterium GWA2_55_11]OGU46732.1 MAG: 3-oxoacyl-[acyl-carrier-protein] reductase [Ignavibacteria bacterium GWC2_56_12]OGU67522.1 MAG: 3-oxoacyl-[acyl-carrier-protein] reductase [Ignavibacteria bacterium RIFCSPHIGHO2_02_FULL_56_12]OGU73317.1 MAG: 3-oxoacyl-[acyl-carrier-protein] reductase [Ignavibacteria bacterium RIFCSPLOWO2_02_FULL_55_14]